MISELLDIRGKVYLSQKSPEFVQKLAEISDRLQINPDFISAVIAFESGYDPQAINPKSKAKGLIQWLDIYAPGDVLAASELKQLDWIEDRYRKLQKSGAQFNTLADVYMAVLAPKYVKSSQSQPIYKAPDPRYTQNAPLDSNKDGTITKCEAAEIPRRKLLAAQKRPRIKLQTPTAPPPSKPPQIEDDSLEILAVIAAGGIFGGLVGWLS